VQLDIAGIALTSEELNHREHRGGTEGTGEGFTARLGGWHPRLDPVDNLQYSWKRG